MPADFRMKTGSFPDIDFSRKGGLTMAKISVYIIAFNEEEKIKHAIQSVVWADEIVVADSFSTDHTADIARSLGARVVQIPFAGFGDLRNRAMAACNHDWIFSLDADERCTPAAREEICRIVADKDSKDAYYVPRRNYFMGKWIRYGGFYPDFRQPQLFRKGVLTFMNDAVHERYEVFSQNPCGRLTAHIDQIPFRNLEEILHKANRYSTLGAEKLSRTAKNSGMWSAFFHGGWAAFSLYILKRGFLDGWPGFVIALANFEGTFYKYAKFYVKKNRLAYFMTPDGEDEKTDPSVSRRPHQ
jgi:glycosyltransferase involved in cell wall biosynthesis